MAGIAAQSQTLTGSNVMQNDQGLTPTRIIEAIIDMLRSLEKSYKLPHEILAGGQMVGIKIWVSLDETGNFTAPDLVAKYPGLSDMLPILATAIDEAMEIFEAYRAGTFSVEDHDDWIGLMILNAEIGKDKRLYIR